MNPEGEIGVKCGVECDVMQVQRLRAVVGDGDADGFAARVDRARIVVVMRCPTLILPAILQRVAINGQVGLGGEIESDAGKHHPPESKLGRVPAQQTILQHRGIVPQPVRLRHHVFS